MITSVCPRCGLVLQGQKIRCPRCNQFLLKGCSECGSQGQCLSKSVTCNKIR